MKLDTRPVIDQLTEDMHAAEVEDRLYALETAVDDAVVALGDGSDFLKVAFDDADDAEAANMLADDMEKMANALVGGFSGLDMTLNSYMGRPA